MLTSNYWKHFKRGKPNLPKCSTSPMLNWQQVKWTSKLLRKFQVYLFIKFSKSIFSKQEINWRIQIGSIQILFWNQAKPSQKFKIKSWGASILLWGPPWIFSLFFLEIFKYSKYLNLGKSQKCLYLNPVNKGCPKLFHLQPNFFLWST